jgi:hypothetical protein
MLLFSLLLLLTQGVPQVQHVHLDRSIRKVKWAKLLAHEFEIDSEMTGTYGQGAYYLVGEDNEQSGGFLDTTFFPIIYRDLNHDGREDAVLTLSCPGSGSFATCLIFLQTAHGPKYVGCAGGPHYVDTLSGDTLLIITAHWVGFDPQCCNRAHEYQRIIAEGDSIRFLPLVVKPVEGMGWVTVKSFYDYLDYKKKNDMAIAYGMLSPDYRNAHPYDTWLNGYATMDSVNVDVDKNSPDSAVRVKITSYDNIDGRTVIKHFAGVWHLKFITNNREMDDRTEIADWFLDRPEIHEVK